MVTVKVPIPYEFRGMTSRMTNSRFLQVSDVIELEIRDVDPTEALTVASANFCWPTQGLPGQGDYRPDQDRSRINPRAEIKFLGGEYYVPLIAFSRTGDEKRPATAQDVIDTMGSFELAVADPFRRYYGEGHDGSYELLALQRYRDLKPLSELKLKGDSERNAALSKEIRVSTAKDEMAKFIVLDGQVWRRTGNEPVLQIGKPQFTVELDIVDYVQHLSDKHDYFRLDELDSALEFIAERHGNAPIRQSFSDLAVTVPETLSFDAEADAMRRAARLVERALDRGAAWREGQFEEAYQSLRDAVFFSRTENPDQLAEILEKVRGSWNNEGLTSFGRGVRPVLEMTLQRWELRPVQRQGQRPR